MSEKQTFTMNVWQITREYAGIAEAGGVKNVACSLAESLVQNGMNVTTFIPFYGCTMMKNLSALTDVSASVALIECGGELYHIEYGVSYINGVRLIFVKHPIFAKKRAVYTYTDEDEAENPAHVRGHGHTDANTMNAVFQKAVIAYAQLSGETPDVVQCQDAHTALIPAFAFASPRLAKRFESTRFFVTIHNAGEGYRQQFTSIEEAYSLTGLPLAMLETGLLHGTVEPFLISSCYATLSTVSPWYAKELLNADNPYTGGFSRCLSEKHIPLIGITNGIDFDRYTPSDKTKSLLPYTFDPLKGKLRGKYTCRTWLLKKLSQNELPSGLECFGSIEHKSDNVYFSYHGRIVHQKGLEVLADAAEKVLDANPHACFIVIGQGDRSLEQHHITMAQKYGGRYVYIRGYERSFVRLCVAVADFIVLPSFFEPCGLEDFIGQIFGTLPVAHAVGGLQKIIDEQTGFLYTPNTPEALSQKLLSLIERKLQKSDSFNECIRYAAQYVYSEYSWQSVVQTQYVPLYRGETPPQVQ